VIGARGPGPRLEHVLLSDIHLNEIVAPKTPGWWAYKGPQSRQDDDLVGLLEALEAQRPSAFTGTEVIFNGDTFDFDLVHTTPPGVRAPLDGLPPTAEASVYKILRILGDHPRFVAGLARFLARGDNRVVFVMGNHDRELCFPEVQEILRTTVARAAPVGRGEAVARAVSFEPWFVYRPGVLYAEHGQQYDATCSYRDVLDPIVPADGRRPAEVETPFGSLMGRHTLCRLGTFNPYNDESFILSLGGYLRHWREHYFPRRPFFTAYFLATGRALSEIFARQRRARARKGRDAARYAAYARAQGVSDDFLATLERLGSPPLVERPRLLLHELWLDRFLLLFASIAFLVVGFTLARTWTQGLLLLSLIPALIFVFRAMGRGSLALQERARWGLVAEQIATRLAVPVVAFGHSHRPERRPLTGGGRYYNLGSWAPVLPVDRGSTLWRARRFLILRPAGGGAVHAVFGRWDHDRQAMTG